MNEELKQKYQKMQDLFHLATRVRLATFSFFTEASDYLTEQEMVTLAENLEKLESIVRRIRHDIFNLKNLEKFEKEEVEL